MSRENDMNSEDFDTSHQTSDAISIDKEYPVLALRDMVVFPKNSASLFIGRTISLKAAQAAYQFDTPLVLLTQKKADTENPSENDLYHIGTLAKVRRYVVMPDGTLNLAVQGIRRIKVTKLNTFEKYYTAYIEPYDLDSSSSKPEEINALTSLATEKFKKQALDYSKLPKESLLALSSSTPDIQQLLAMVIGHLEIKTADKQELLECPTESLLLEKLITILGREGARLEVEGKIKERVRNQMEKNQREYYLNEQMKAIQKELSGSEEVEEDEATTYQKKINNTKLSKEAKAKA
ncbi:MAG: LON peptidase substrate-binding domain-containing protein, partial [Alphaproteobacteria bacterium]|nr:LON peptidase substrate-binding domain-containing protein [Alphaproteobacteria bacterium]